MQRPNYHMRHLLIPLNTKNKNNRIYTEESFVSIAKEYLIQYCPNTEHIYSGFDIGNVKATIRDLQIEPNGLCGEVTMLDVPFASNISLLLDAQEMVIRPRSEAKISDDGVVTECKIIGFDFIKKYKDSFNFESDY